MFGVSWSGGWAKANPEGSRTVPGKAAGGTWLPPRAPRGGGRVVGKSRVQRGFLSLPGGLLQEIRGGAKPPRGVFPAPGERRRRQRRPRPSPEVARATPGPGRGLPPRRSRAVDCGLGAAAASLRPRTLSSRTYPGRGRQAGGRAAAQIPTARWVGVLRERLGERRERRGEERQTQRRERRGEIGRASCRERVSSPV